ncbi:Uncharacterised protein [Vibrio cholerae]|nr:Uncharacterised protein [Vibrio cholerae]
MDKHYQTPAPSRLRLPMIFPLMMDSVIRSSTRKMSNSLTLIYSGKMVEHR